MVLVGIVILLLWFFQIVFLEKFYTSFEVRGVLAGAEDITADIGDLGDIRLSPARKLCCQILIGLPIQ